ncbi:GntR family transcriptional regulator [Desertibacillus haloalkaliphilus]|uniref:GntR family transcriptional regulator n=1 Tax=Desertibacillus haloalkaliphilus TaxID=1328930 RepID=UPI001C27D1B4|nr:GntR family transcriptional regulator [Desertibacillus haloalkaliphilus]MBU8907846.1 GntR family transcriptional regulator [Desertibacillus haloalkaliphilus]
MSLGGLQRSRYLLIIDKIKQDIESGYLQPGEKLPSENKLAKKLGVSRTTLREALRILEEEGVVVRRHGIGTFINKKPVFYNGIEELTSITEMIEKEGKVAGNRILFSDFVTPIAQDKDVLNLKDDELVFLVKRVRTADGSPVIYCIDKIPAHIVPDDAIQDNESIFDFLEKEGDVTINYATAVIETIGYHEEISKILDCDQESPLLILKQTHFDMNDQPVLYSINFFRADQFSFSVFRKRVNF